MTGWLLDTDVLSAFAPGRRAVTAQVAEWFKERTDELFLSAITAAEIEASRDCAAPAPLGELTH